MNVLIMADVDQEHTDAIDQVAHWRGLPDVTPDDALRTLGFRRWCPGGWPDVFKALVTCQSRVGA